MGERGQASIHSKLRNYELLQDRTTSKGRHLVLGHQRRRYRLLVTPPGAAMSGYFVPSDRWVQIRLDAIEEFDAACRQPRHATSDFALRPSVYQQRRLMLLLNILDATHASDGTFATIRQIAEKVVYRNTDLGRAIEWKTSSHRRQTQRLINEARFLVEGGYRLLLSGRVQPTSRKL